MRRDVERHPPGLIEARNAEVECKPAIWAAWLRGQHNWMKDPFTRALDEDYRRRNEPYLPGDTPLILEPGPDYITQLERARSSPIPSETFFPQEIPLHEKVNRQYLLPAARSFYPPPPTKRERKEYHSDRGMFCVLVCDRKIPLTEAFWIVLGDIADAFTPPESRGIEHTAFRTAMADIRNLLSINKRIEAAKIISTLPLNQRGPGKRKKQAWRLQNVATNGGDS